jgi:hypothetical protein
MLLRIDRHEDGDPPEKMPCPLDDVEMTWCDGVEGAGIDRVLPQPAPAGRSGHRPRLRLAGLRQNVLVDGIIALWAAPRSRSTAFFASMREHGNVLALHEPFCNIADYGETTVNGRLVHTPDELIARLLSLGRTRAVFFKDTTDRPHPAVLADLPFLTGVAHTFLIRRPAEIAASYYAIRPGLTIDEIGLATLYELYQAVLAASDRPPVVIDSADLVANPAGIMAAYCAAVGIPYREQALSWHPGPRPEWSRSARWHAAVERTSAFTQLASSYQETVANNAKLAEFSAYHEPYYQELRASRLAPSR